MNHYRMPAEWERHEATWLAWPTNRLTFPGTLLEEVRTVYLEMIGALLAGEQVGLLVPDKRWAKKISSYFSRHRHRSRLILHRVATADVWIRDYGPIFVFKDHLSGKKSGELAYTQWQFNAWGKKYAEHLRDNGIVSRIKALSIYPALKTDRILEGGSIDVNGVGLGLTTRQCLLNPNRNPGLDRRRIERMLRDFLGIRRLIWLKGGIAGDDTDGHVDDVARFVSPRTVVAVRAASKQDPDYAILEDNWKILKRFGTRDCGRLKVLALPAPEAVFCHRKPAQRLPASYANFYIANKVVLVPTFNDPADRVALSVFRRIFPNKQVIGLNCRSLVHGLGSIHCITQQQPIINR
ncbi:MAG: agmatine deiminase family protein [Candidatus Omnitrophota bacterium]